MQINNLFQASPLIVQRLKDTTTGFRTIGTASLLNSLRDIVTQCDGAYVLPGRGDVTSKAGASIADEQQWVIGVSVARSVDPSDVATLENKLGDYGVQIVRALHSHRLSDAFMPMQFEGHGEITYGDGYAEFPLLFTVKTAIKGA